MIYLLTFLMLSCATANCMNPDVQKSETAIGAAAAVAPNAPHAPQCLPIQKKIMYAAAKAKRERPLEQFIQPLELQTLIAQYACEWVPCRIIDEFITNTAYDPSDIKFSQAEDYIMSYKKKDPGQRFHTKYELKTKKITDQQEVDLVPYSLLSYTGEEHIRFPNGNNPFVIKNIGNKTTKKLEPANNRHRNVLCSASSARADFVVHGEWDWIVLADLKKLTLTEIPVKGYIVEQVALSPDGKYIAAFIRSTNNAKYILLINHEAKLHKTFEIGQLERSSNRDSHFSATTHGLYFSPNNTSLLIYGLEIYFVDIETSKITKHNPNHQGRVISISSIKDGTILATAAKMFDSEICIWKYNSSGTLDLIQTIEFADKTHNNHVEKIVFSPSGKYLAIGSTQYGTNGAITVWKNNAEDILQIPDDVYDHTETQKILPLGDRVKHIDLSNIVITSHAK